MTNPQNDMIAAMQRVIARSTEDADFRARLKAEPVSVLKAEGIVMPSDAELEVVEDTPSLIHMVLPPKPKEGVLSPVVTSSFGRVLVAAWDEEGAKAALLADGTAVLRSNGVRVPDGTTVRFVENTGRKIHLIVPPMAMEGEISEEDLEGLTASGGSFWDDVGDFFTEDVAGGLETIGNAVITGTKETVNGFGFGMAWVAGVTNGYLQPDEAPDASIYKLWK